MKKETKFLVHPICCCIFLVLFLPGIVTAAEEMRTALVIGNSAYSSGPLKNPANDAADMAAMLKDLGFSVTLNENISLREMDEAIEAFGNRLKRGGVGLFYYAGHGVQVNGTNYLLPIGTKINKETDVKYQAVDANKILDEMATANNGLNIIILDACRDNPFARSFRNATRGLAVVSSAPSGTFISYSTSPGNVARDGVGRNSPYTAALLEYLPAPGLSISDVFVNVRARVKKETGQVPWELSSLEGRFYFKPQDSRQTKLSDVPPQASKIEIASKEKMALPLPDKPSVAVMPFTNMSGEKELEYLGDGLAEGIIDGLAKFEQIFVIARNSTFTYKGKPVNVKQVAEEMGVRYVIVGSLQQEKTRVRITVQLIDALTGRHLFSERYDRDLKDILSLQDEITLKVLTAVQVKLTIGEVARIYEKGTKNLDAYLKVVQARELKGGTMNKESVERAIQLIEEAIALDPEYGYAYSMLSTAHFDLVIMGASASPRESLQKALELGKKAIALDDSNSSVHAHLTFTYSALKEYDKAIAEAEKAISLSPNSALGYWALGTVLSFSGRHQEAVPLLQKSLRLSPIPIHSQVFGVLGNSYSALGQYEEVIATYKKMLQIYGPDHFTAHLWLASAYAAMGREKEARAEAAEVMRIDPKFSVERFLRVQPIDQARKDRMADNMRKAGLK